MLIPTPMATCAWECNAGSASTANNNAKYFRYRISLRPPSWTDLQSGDSLLNRTKLLCLARMREPSRLRKVVAGEQLPDNSLLDFDVSLRSHSKLNPAAASATDENKK